MTAPLPTPGEVEEVRQRHVPYAPFAPSDETEFCRCCERLWPCDADRLRALVDSLTGERDRWNAQWQRDRLDAVLATVGEIEQANGYGHKVGHTLTREQHAHDLDRIRRAATGETTCTRSTGNV